MSAKKAATNVVENVKGSELPARFLGAIDPSHRLRVTVEDMDEARRSRLRRFAGAAQTRNTSIEAAVERVRSLRDETPEERE